MKLILNYYDLKVNTVIVVGVLSYTKYVCSILIKLKDRWLNFELVQYNLLFSGTNILQCEHDKCETECYSGMYSLSI